MNNKAYNITTTPVATAQRKKNANGKPMITFRATMTLRGREVERTVIAQGAAADLLKGKVRKGTPVAVRALIEYAPGEDGKRGGQFLSVVALPRTKSEAAAA